MTKPLLPLLLALTAMALSCTGNSDAPDPTSAYQPPNYLATADAGNSLEVLNSLEARPLQFPQLTAGEPCPISTEPQILGMYRVAGVGPIYTPSGGGSLRKILTSSEQIDGWYSLKTLWISSGSYFGPALVRGRRLDGSGDVRFSYNRVERSGRFTSHGQQRLVENLWFPAGDTGVSAGGYGPGARYMPSSTDVNGQGCYAWQIDGIDFSYLIIFEVVLTGTS